MAMSVEQRVRDLLTLAIREGLVGESDNYDDPDPQVRTAGELCGVSNLLAEILRAEYAAGRQSVTG